MNLMVGDRVGYDYAMGTVKSISSYTPIQYHIEWDNGHNEWADMTLLENKWYNGSMTINGSPVAYGGLTSTLMRQTPLFVEPTDEKKEEVVTDFPRKFVPPSEGKCPSCNIGDLVIYFGVRKYCTKCNYKE